MSTISLKLLCKRKQLLWNTFRSTIGALSGPQIQQIGMRASSDKPEIPKNVIDQVYSASYQPENGKIYDRKPFKMRLYPKKNYMWCLCGYSKSQPICDGSHKRHDYRTTLKPIKFQVAEEGDYWLCNCKHTKLRPFCDGTHKEV